MGENRAVLEEVLIIWFSFGDCSLKICYCTLGTRVPLQTQQGRVRFLQNAVMLEHLLSNPHLMLASGTGMVDILVPRLPREEPNKAQEHHPAGVNGVGNGWEDVGPKRMGRRPIIPDLSVANGGRNAGQVKNAATIQQVNWLYSASSVHIFCSSKILGHAMCSSTQWLHQS